MPITTGSATNTPADADAAAEIDDTTFPGNVGTLNVKEALPLIREAEDIEILDTARRAETNRADGFRESVIAAIQKREDQLGAVAKEEELEERLSPSNIKRMRGPDLREVAAVRGLPYQGRGARGLRKALLEGIDD